MKHLIATFITAFVAALLVMSCSAAQKQAEGTIAKNESDCAIQCAVQKALANEAADKAAEECAVMCTTEILTNSDTRESFMRLFAGAKAGAMKYGQSQLDGGK